MYGLSNIDCVNGTFQIDADFGFKYRCDSLKKFLEEGGEIDDDETRPNALEYLPATKTRNAENGRNVINENFNVFTPFGKPGCIKVQAGMRSETFLESFEL